LNITIFQGSRTKNKPGFMSAIQDKYCKPWVKIMSKFI